MTVAYFRSLADRFFHRSQTENDLEEELRSHIQLRAEALERSGLAWPEAERRARLDIGATTAIFSVVDATLLTPLPYPKSEQLVSIQDNFPGVSAQDVGLSEPE